MKTLKIKKRRYKQWHEIDQGVFLYDRVERRDYIVQMSEKEYFEYVRWKEV